MIILDSMMSIQPRIRKKGIMDLPKLDIKKPSTPVNAPHSNIPVTQEEIEKRKKRMNQAEEIGASITKFEGEETENT